MELKLKNPRTSQGARAGASSWYQAQTAVAPELSTSTLEIRMRLSARRTKGLTANVVSVALDSALMSRVFLKCDVAQVKGQFAVQGHFMAARPHNRSKTREFSHGRPAALVRSAGCRPTWVYCQFCGIDSKLAKSGNTSHPSAMAVTTADTSRSNPMIPIVDWWLRLNARRGPLFRASAHCCLVLELVEPDFRFVP